MDCSSMELIKFPIAEGTKKYILSSTLGISPSRSVELSRAVIKSIWLQIHRADRGDNTFDSLYEVSKVCQNVNELAYAANAHGITTDQIRSNPLIMIAYMKASEDELDRIAAGQMGGAIIEEANRSGDREIE